MDDNRDEVVTDEEQAVIQQVTDKLRGVFPFEGVPVGDARWLVDGTSERRILRVTTEDGRVFDFTI